MTPYEYQQLANRTLCDQSNAIDRMCAGRRLSPINCTDGELIPVTLNHSIIGMCGEVGELAAELQRWIYYGKELNIKNIKEELGDVLWYIAEACNALGINMEDLMKWNIEKLKARYPERYTDQLADEENRDKLKELAAIK